MYATAADLIAKFESRELIDLTDRAFNGTIDEAPINIAISEAAAEVNSYLAKVVILPIENVPEILKTRAIDIARYNLWSSRGEMPEVVTNRYKAAIAWLKDINSGRVNIDVEGVKIPDAAGGVEIDVPPRRFTRDSLRGY